MRSRISVLVLFCFIVLNINAEAESRFCRFVPDRDCDVQRDEEVQYENKLYVKGAGGFVIYNKFSQHSDDGIYANKSPKSSFSAYIGLGNDFSKYMSAEILGRFSPLKYRSVSVATGTSSVFTTTQNMNSYALFANLYLKYPIKLNYQNLKQIIPYITLGPGIVHNQSKEIKGFGDNANSITSAPGKNINSFAWNIGTGIMLVNNYNFSVDIGYRYLSLGKIGCKKGGDGTSSETNKVIAQDILLGLTYQFN